MWIALGNIKGNILKIVILKSIMVKLIDTYQYFYTCTKQPLKKYKLCCTILIMGSQYEIHAKNAGI